MLTVIIWRLWFEFLCLLKVLGVRGKVTYYFAFGANLDPEVLKKRKIEVFNRKFIWLENFEVKFNHETPFEDCGFASIEKSDGKRVPGVILTIPKIDALRMDCFEACFMFKRYRKAYVKIDSQNVFYYYSGRPIEGLKPTKIYLEKILRGYNLILKPDSSFISKLKQTESIPEMKVKYPPRFLIINYNLLGVYMKPILEKYDYLCMKFFIFFIFKNSIFQRFLPQRFPMSVKK